MNAPTPHLGVGAYLRRQPLSAADRAAMAARAARRWDEIAALGGPAVREQVRRAADNAARAPYFWPLRRRVRYAISVILGRVGGAA